MKRNILMAVFTCLVCWAVWAGHWSESAQKCFSAGGTQFDWLGWSCHRHTKVTLEK